MLNRKENKSSNGTTGHHRNDHRPPVSAKGRPRRRFIISAKAAGHPAPPEREVRNGAREVRNGTAKTNAPLSQPKAAPGAHPHPPGSPAAPGAPVDLAETIKT